MKAIKYKRDSTALVTLIKHNTKVYKAILEKYPHAQKILAPIPKHKNKQRIQGYNQSAVIAEVFSNLYDIPVQEVLIKTKHTAAQVTMRHRSQRLQNTLHTMSTHTPLSSTVLYIIIDDVYTTGATINEAFRALKENGATTVCAITLAHGKY